MLMAQQAQNWQGIQDKSFKEIIMNLQARKISGSTFTKEDKLEVVLNTDNQPMASVVHTIELVSGVNVTHGGGGQPDKYLHYKAVERDADADGIIDYSSVIMNLVQEEKGTSVIKVVCQVTTKADIDNYNAEYIAWENTPQDGTKLGTEPTPPSPTTFKTGDITLEWNEDVFV